ncbi:MAG TPA: protein kinase [Ktedonobacterales bacterium]
MAETQGEHSGLRLAQRYQLLEQLARGALATVYRGQDLVLRRPVAVKVVPAEHIGAYQAALRESAPLTHPGVVCVYDAIEQGGYLFLVQELVTAKPFGVYFRQGVPVERGVDLGRQLASALAYAHLHDVMHGDLTPSAVLVDRTATVRINNFGLPPDIEYFTHVSANLRASLSSDAPTTENATPASQSAPPTNAFTGGAPSVPPALDLATPAGDTRAVGYLLWQFLSEPVAALGAQNGDELRRFRPEVPETLRDLVLEVAVPAEQSPGFTAHALVLELERLSGALARSRPVPSALTPPAVIAARAAAQEAPWASEETIQGGRRLANAAHPAARTVPDGEPLMPPAIATRPAALADRPETPPLLPPPLPPPRNDRRPVAPLWEPVDTRYDVAESRRTGFPLIGVLLLGTVLFVLFFLVGYFSTLLH